MASHASRNIVLAAFASAMLLGKAADAGQRSQVYAAPNVFGNWSVVRSQVNGPGTYTIKVEPIGKTSVVGEVHYYRAKDNKQVVESFSGSTTIKTSNSVSNIEVPLKGTPTGSSCWVDVNP